MDWRVAPSAGRGEHDGAGFARRRRGARRDGRGLFARRRGGGGFGAGKASKRGDSQIHQLHLLARQVVCVQPLVQVVEIRGHSVQSGARHRAGGDFHRNLPALMPVAQVGGARHGAGRFGDGLAREPVGGVALHVPIRRRHLRRRRLAARVDERLRVVVSQVGEQQPVGRKNAGRGRDDDGFDSEQRRQGAGVERSRAAEGDEGEVRRVESAPDGYGAHRARHVVVGDFDYAGGGGFHAHAERVGDALADGAAREVGVQRDLAAEQTRGQMPQRQARVGDGGRVPAERVAGRPRMRPRAFGSHDQAAGGRHARHAPAARADGGDVEHRQAQRQAADVALDRHVGRAAARQAYVGARAADVERYEVGMPGGERDSARAHHAGDGARQDGVDSLPRGGVRAGYAAVGLHYEQRRANPLARGRRFEVGEIAPDARHHAGVERGRHRPLELPELRQNFGRQRNRDARAERVPQNLGCAALVGVVGV